MNLEVGMYVRTKNGLIFKIQGINEYSIALKNTCCERLRDKYFTFPNEEKIYEISKSSFNLIDLIEVGDYVNGMRVKNIMSVGTSQYVIKKGDGKYVCCGDYGLMDDGSGRSCYALQWNNNQIKEVLTREQYEENYYKVGE